jgi:hypothetical protein
MAKEKLLERLDQIDLPATPLDHIIDELGGPGMLFAGFIVCLCHLTILLWT